MSIFGDAFNHLCRPLIQSYNSGVWGTALNAAYNLWWINARRRDWDREQRKLFFAFQTALRSTLNTTVCDTFTGSVLNIIKLENINDSYTRRRDSYNKIFRAWRGDLTDPNEFFTKKWILTTTKIFLYLKDTLFFFMTCVDATKAFEFCPQARLEALTNVINNTVRVGQLLLLEKEADNLKNKLRGNLQLIQSSFQMNEDSALEFIEIIYLSLKEIQNHTLVRATKGLTTSTEQASKCAEYLIYQAETASKYVLKGVIGSKKEKKTQKTRFCQF